MVFRSLVSRFLINKRFQFKLVGILAIPLVASCAVYTYFIVTFFKSFESIGENSGLPSDHIYFEFMSNNKERLIEVLGLSFSVAFTFFLIFGIFLSHKVAGPMFRFKRHLKAMESLPIEELEKIKFRKSDFFKDIENAYNLFVDSKIQISPLKKKSNIIQFPDSANIPSKENKKAS